MTDLTAASRPRLATRTSEPVSRLAARSQTALTWSARMWFATAVAGQWIFAAYVAGFYGRSAMQGSFAPWNNVMPHGYMPGHSFGNGVVALHLLFAIAILFGGPLQLSAAVRKHAPAFHRWNGRVYMTAVAATALGGLYMVWVRGSVGDFTQHLGISGDAVLILITATLALRSAMKRDFRTHRRWALRLFIVANGVWFFRVGLMLWVVLNGGPAGFDTKSFTGPFLSIWSFADYLLPLAILELYLRTKERSGSWGRLAMAGALVVLTLAMSVGIVVAAMGMWIPRMR